MKFWGIPQKMMHKFFSKVRGRNISLIPHFWADFSILTVQICKTPLSISSIRLVILEILSNFNIEFDNGQVTTPPYLSTQVLLEAVMVARYLMSHLKGEIRVHGMQPLFFSFLRWLGHQGLKWAGGNISICMHRRITIISFPDSQSNILLFYIFCL